MNTIQFRGVLLITGHYGSGKTNLALNIALDALHAGVDTTIVDLDIVNPYFRSSEYVEDILAAGGKMVCPVLAHSSVDVPSLSAGVIGAIEDAQKNPDSLLVVDVGGDDVGATALGRFSAEIDAAPYQMLFVSNSKRNLTQTLQESVEILKAIEQSSNLKVTGIFANDHLMLDTDESCIEAGENYAIGLSQITGIPVLGQTVPKWLLNQHADDDWITKRTLNIYPIDKKVKVPWETKGQ